MTVSMTSVAPFLMVFMTSGRYALATIGTKLSVDPHCLSGIVLIPSALLLAALAEGALVPMAKLPLVYPGVLIGEIILVVGYTAWLIAGLGLQHMAGAAGVILGFGLVTYHT